MNVGPQSYSPHEPQLYDKGTIIGAGLRIDNKSMLTPGPGEYKILGDFDFRDPNVQNDQVGGKNPKFHYGIKPTTKAPNADFPGPGTYETDQYPMNQKNIAYWIGTDVRKDLGVPNAAIYPGPGNYDHQHFTMDGPAIS